MFREQALEHYRSDFSKTETPFFISNKKITLLFFCITVSIVCFCALLLYPNTNYISIPIDGYINNGTEIIVTTNNISTFQDKIKENKWTNFT